MQRKARTNRVQMPAPTQTEPPNLHTHNAHMHTYTQIFTRGQSWRTNKSLHFAVLACILQHDLDPVHFRSPLTQFIWAVQKEKRQNIFPDSHSWFLIPDSHTTKHNTKPQTHLPGLQPASQVDWRQWQPAAGGTQRNVPLTHWDQEWYTSHTIP